MLPAVTPAPARGDAVLLSDEPKPTSVAAYGGIAVWSGFEAATGAFRLRALRNGVVETLPVAARGVPFDVDLGPGPTGSTVAVYSRCRVEPDGSEEYSGLPEYVRGGGCDVYAYDFATATERRVDGVRSAASEVLPSIWRSRVAFARSGGGRRAVVRVGRFARGARSSAVPGGPAGPRGGPGPLALAIHARRLAFTWRYRVGRCDGWDESGGPDTRVELRLYDGGRRSRRLLAGRPCTGDGLVSPAVDAQQATVFERIASQTLTEGNAFATVSLGSGAVTRAPATSAAISTAIDGTSRYSVTVDDRGWHVVVER